MVGKGSPSINLALPAGMESMHFEIQGKEPFAMGGCRGR